MIPVCPKCDKSLFILNFKGVEVDFCQKCRGLWLDAGELESLMTQTGATADDPLLEVIRETKGTVSDKKALCPRCDQPMHKITITSGKGKNPLALDRCERGHGFWFDAHELRTLLTMFPPASGASKTVDFLNDLLGASRKT